VSKGSSTDISIYVSLGNCEP